MKKIAQAIKLAYKAIGLELSEEDIRVLDEAESEDVFVPFFDKLTNQIPSYGTKQKEAGRAEIYQGIDAKLGEKLETLKDILGEEKFNKIKSTQGVAKLGMLADDFAEAYAAAKKARKEADSFDQQKANETIRELTKKIQELTNGQQQLLEQKEKEVTDRYEGMLLNEALYTKVRGVKDLAKEYADEEIIRGVILPKVHRIAAEKKVSIRRKGDAFELFREDGMPFIENNAELTLDDLVTQATRHYARKSDGGDSSIISVDGMDNSSYSLNIADAWQHDAGGLI